MKRINKLLLAESLSFAAHGVTKGREYIDQSDCFVFQKGRVRSFNSELSVSAPCGLEIECAILYKFFSRIMHSTEEGDVEYSIEDGNLVFHAGRSVAKFRIENEIKLPIETIEQPVKWNDLSDAFPKALEMILPVATESKKSARFILTCVHFTPNFVEAFDGKQAIRYKLQLPIKSPLIIKTEAVEALKTLNATQVSETENWIHFRNPKDVIMSVRKNVTPYVNLDTYKLFDKDDSGIDIVIPANMKDIVAKAALFAADNKSEEQQYIRCTLSPRRITVSGNSANGAFSQSKKTSYNGDSITFLISERIVLFTREEDTIAKLSVTENRIRVREGALRYASTLAIQGKANESPPAKKLAPLKKKLTSLKK
jgi:hypothetical protein